GRYLTATFIIGGLLGLEPSVQPGGDLRIEQAAVLALVDPVILFGKHDEFAGHFHALQRAPVFQRIVQRHAEIVLAHRDQRRRTEVRRETDRVLLAPYRALFPWRPAEADFAPVDSVAGAPLGLQVHDAGVRDQALVARGGGLQPVGEMTAITRAAGALPAAIDEVELADRRVGRFIDLVGRALERIALDGAREGLAESR